MRAVNAKAVNQRKILSSYREKIRNQAFPGKEKFHGGGEPKPVGFCENSPRKGRSQPVATARCSLGGSVNTAPFLPHQTTAESSGHSRTGQ